MLKRQVFPSLFCLCMYAGLVSIYFDVGVSFQTLISICMCIVELHALLKLSRKLLNVLQFQLLRGGEKFLVWTKNCLILSSFLYNVKMVSFAKGFI